MKMTEAQIGFLYKISSLLRPSQESQSSTFLKSYYLMRCKELTRGYGLPEKQFSTKTRCPHCCLEWMKGAGVKVKSIKLSTRQKKRIKCSKKNVKNQEYIKQRKELLQSNEMEQICTFCKHSTKTPIIKPDKQIPKRTLQDCKPKEKPQEHDVTKKKKKKNNLPKESKSNVYASAFDVFSLNNQNNTLASSKKAEPKIITNDKKRKDKFAGLCQQAVLVSAKLKEQKNKQNKLNLFMKPSK